MEFNLNKAILIILILLLGIRNFVTGQALAAGYGHSLFLCPDYTAMSVGKNTWGQLGDGTTVDKSNPIQVFGLGSIIGVASHDSHSIF